MFQQKGDKNSYMFCIRNGCKKNAQRVRTDANMMTGANYVGTGVNK